LEYDYTNALTCLKDDPMSEQNGGLQTDYLSTKKSTNTSSGVKGGELMDTSAYSIAQLAGDLKEICARTKDEREILSRARPLARRTALAKDSWLKPHMYEADPEQGFGVHVLHEEPDHTTSGHPSNRSRH
jgi:hypothetical protein